MSIICLTVVSKIDDDEQDAGKIKSDTFVLRSACNAGELYGWYSQSILQEV